MTSYMEAIERSQDKIARDEKRLREAAQILAIVYKAGADDSDLRRRIGRWLTDDEKELA